MEISFLLFLSVLDSHHNLSALQDLTLRVTQWTTFNRAAAFVCAVGCWPSRDDNGVGVDMFGGGNPRVLCC